MLTTNIDSEVYDKSKEADETNSEDRSHDDGGDEENEFYVDRVRILHQNLMKWEINRL